jgi:hypothetical protein
MPLSKMAVRYFESMESAKILNYHHRTPCSREVKREAKGRFLIWKSAVTDA